MLGRISRLHQHIASYPPGHGASRSAMTPTQRHCTWFQLIFCHSGDGEGCVSHQLWDQAGCNFCKEAGTLQTDPRIKNSLNGSQPPLDATNSNGMHKLQCHVLQKTEPKTEVYIPKHIKNLFDQFPEIFEIGKDEPQLRDGKMANFVLV